MKGPESGAQAELVGYTFHIPETPTHVALRCTQDVGVRRETTLIKKIRRLRHSIVRSTTSQFITNVRGTT
jgi:hypothetical protein